MEKISETDSIHEQKLPVRIYIFELERVRIDGVDYGNHQRGPIWYYLVQ